MRFLIFVHAFVVFCVSTAAVAGSERIKLTAHVLSRIGDRPEDRFAALNWLVRNRFMPGTARSAVQTRLGSPQNVREDGTWVYWTNATWGRLHGALCRRQDR